MSSFLTIIMSTIFALSLVPTGAWAADNTANNKTGSAQKTGTLAATPAEIKIANPKTGETYTIYRLFELASFDDENPATNTHGTNDQDEAYSYVINDTSGWYWFLTQYGPAGKDNPNKFAVLETNSTTGAANDTSNAYFVIENQTITVDGTSTYHVIRATDSFSNLWDDTGDNSGNYSTRSNNGEDADTAGQGIDYVDTANKSTVQNFAQEALKYAANPDSGHTVTAVKTATGDATTTPQTLLARTDSGAKLGYYLVGTSMGTLAALDTTNDTVTIYEKNDEPEIAKKVLKKQSAIPATITKDFLTGGADTTWVDNTDADVGDYVMFRTVVTAQQGMKGYVLHDIMENGLSFVNGTVSSSWSDRYNSATAVETEKDYSLKVYLVRKADDKIIAISPTATLTTGGTSGTNYALKAITETEPANRPSDQCDFEIAFQDFDGAAAGNDKVTLAGAEVGQSNVVAYDVKDGDQIVVTYWAQLNENAVVYNNTANQNGATDAQKEASQTHVAPTVSTSDGDGTVTVPGDVMRDNNSDERNTNHTVLTYGAKAYTKFESATVTTYQFDVVKTNEYSSDVSSLLKDAKFELYKAHEKGSTETATYTGLDSKDYVVEGSALYFTPILREDGAYLHKSDVTTGGGTTLTTTTSKELHLEGLESGTYLLVETEAPKGYNQLAKPVVIKINPGSDTWNTTNHATPNPTNEGTINTTFTPNSGAAAITATDGAWDANVATSSNAGYPATYTKSDNGGVQVVNQTGQELPSTGGIGTTIFYVAGGVLVVGATVMLVAKRRIGAEA